MSSRPTWSRIVLKLSGEALAEPSGFGLDNSVLSQVATEVREAREELGTNIAIVVGGGNFWRGIKGAGQGMDQAQADYMGMLATVMNGLALQDALERVGQQSRVMTAIEMPKIAEPYIRRRAERHLEKGRVVILAGGTGNPFFTTDTAAALRAAIAGATAGGPEVAAAGATTHGHDNELHVAAAALWAAAVEPHAAAESTTASTPRDTTAGAATPG